MKLSRTQILASIAGALGALGVGAWALLRKKAAPLDANLPADTKAAVAFALANESDPSKLRAFGASLLPDYPLANAALFARAARTEPALAGKGSG
jgi:hypothetical protein